MSLSHRNMARPEFDRFPCLWQTGNRANDQQEALLMPMESHLAELERRHHAIEKEIEDALAHPSTDQLVISDLKRRKLLLKDEITRLKDGPAVVH